MARKHVVKYYARQIQHGIKESEIPEDFRAEAVDMAKTLPLREDMKKESENKE